MNGQKQFEEVGREYIRIRLIQSRNVAIIRLRALYNYD